MYLKQKQGVHQRRIKTLSVVENVFKIVLALMAGFGLAQAFAKDNIFFGGLLVFSAFLSQMAKDFALSLYYEYNIDKDLHEIRKGMGQTEKPYKLSFSPYIYVSAYIILSFFDLTAGAYGVYRSVLYMQDSKVIATEKNEQFALDSLKRKEREEIEQINAQKKVYFSAANWNEKLDQKGQRHLILLDKEILNIKQRYNALYESITQKTKEDVKAERKTEEIIFAVFLSVFFEVSFFFLIKIKFNEVFNMKVSKIKNWKKNKSQKEITSNTDDKPATSVLLDHSGEPIGFRIKPNIRSCICCGTDISHKKANAVFCSEKCRKTTNKY